MFVLFLIFDQLKLQEFVVRFYANVRKEIFVHDEESVLFALMYVSFSILECSQLSDFKEKVSLKALRIVLGFHHLLLLTTYNSL